MKCINNKLYISYSELSPDEGRLYIVQIHNFLIKLNWEYSDFTKWFSNLFVDGISLKHDREIIVCESDFQIVGIAILKSDEIEKKICTLRVAKPFQKQGIGKQLIELSFEWLNDDKPLITIHNSKKHEFNKLFNHYNFKLEEKKWGYYNLFSTELVFNGSLPEKKMFLNELEIIDLKEQVKNFLLLKEEHFESFVAQWLYFQWLQNSKKIIQ